VQVKGKHEPVSVYEIFSADAPEQVELKMRTNAQFLEGLALFQSGKLGAALQVFQEIVRINPLDAAAAAYVHRLEIRRAARAQA
jgi:Flp pilus assembly protein TadD